MWLPDVNVLVYAHRPESEHHARSATWLTKVAEGAGPFALSELVISGSLRVVTGRRIFTEPSPVGVALDFVEQLTVRPTCRLLRPGPRHLGIFVDLCRRHTLGGGLVADAYHAALAIETGCTWVTFDTDFARFDGLTWTTP